mgnify:CR=1 FL=1
MKQGRLAAVNQFAGRVCWRQNPQIPGGQYLGKCGRGTGSAHQLTDVAIFCASETADGCLYELSLKLDLTLLAKPDIDS